MVRSRPPASCRCTSRRTRQIPCGPPSCTPTRCAATAVGLLLDEVPRVHYMLGALGESVRVAPYATYGTPELAVAMGTALAGRHGCLLRNHGTVTTGIDLAQAYERTLQLEFACRLWLLARAVGEPELLPADELRRLARKLTTYGQPVIS